MCMQRPLAPEHTQALQAGVHTHACAQGYEPSDEGSEYKADAEEEVEDEEDDVADMDYGTKSGVGKKQKVSRSAASKKCNNKAPRKLRRTKEESFVPVSTLLAALHSWPNLIAQPACVARHVMASIRAHPSHCPEGHY